MSLPSSLRLKQPSESFIPQKSFESKDSGKLPSSLRPKEQNQETSVDYDENDLQRSIERQQATLTSRALEAVIGLPSDLANFAGSIFGQDLGLPGSESLRKFSEEATGGYTKPQTQFEEKVGETFQDMALMALPGARQYSLMRNIGIPVIGNLSKYGLEKLGAGEKAQSYGKMGLMVALDLLANRNPGGAKAYTSELFRKADNAIPEGMLIDASKLEKSLEKLESELSKGGSRPTTRQALEKVSEIGKEIKSGTIDAKRLAAYRPSINEAIEELGGFKFDIPKRLKVQTVKNLNDVKNSVISTLNDYGEKFNPEYLKNAQSANEAYAAIQKSNLIANLLHDKIPYAPKSAAVQSLFHYAPYAAGAALTKLSPLAGAGAITGYGAYQGLKVLIQVMKSPALRKYYTDVLISAARENIPKTTKNLIALDKAMANEKDQKARKEEGAVNIKQKK